VAALLAAWESLPEPPIVWLCPNCHAYAHNYQNVDPADLEPGVLEKIFEVQEIGSRFLARYANSILNAAKQMEGNHHERFGSVS